MYWCIAIYICIYYIRHSNAFTNGWSFNKTSAATPWPGSRASPRRRPRSRRPAAVRNTPGAGKLVNTWGIYGDSMIFMGDIMWRYGNIKNPNLTRNGIRWDKNGSTIQIAGLSLGLPNQNALDTSCRSYVDGRVPSCAQPAVGCRLWEVSPWAATRCHPSRPVRRTRPGLCAKVAAAAGACWRMVLQIINLPSFLLTQDSESASLRGGRGNVNTGFLYTTYPEPHEKKQANRLDPTIVLWRWWLTSPSNKAKSTLAMEKTVPEPQGKLGREETAKRADLPLYTCCFFCPRIHLYPFSRQNKNTCLTSMSLSHRCPMAPEKTSTRRCASMHQENHWNMYYWNVIESTIDHEMCGSPWLPPRPNDDITCKVRHHLSTFLGNWKIHATRNHGITPHRALTNQVSLRLSCSLPSKVAGSKTDPQWWGLCLIRRFQSYVWW